MSALIFDMNGTMIDDMSFHTDIWYKILTKDLGATLTYEELKVQMYGKNQELLVRVFGKDRFTMKEMDHYAMEKERQYQEMYLPHLKLIDGLDGILEEAYRQQIPMAIGSAAITSNVDFMLDNLAIRHYFDAIVSADDVNESKPHPQTFLKASEKLQVSPSECIVFEDAPKGVEAAKNAGMKCVVLLTTHKEHEFEMYDNIITIIKDYKDLKLDQLN
ncbi:MAG: HAD family hydrolase [Cytophagaceae bacterium]